jgi:nuclear pore complex protein Nup133
MFSPRPGEGTPSASTRTRRRQRTSDTVSQPKAKRQRLPLSNVAAPQSQDPPEMEEVRGGSAAPPRAEARNGIDSNLLVAAGAPRRDLTVRSKKPKPVDRASKGDGSVVLVSVFWEGGDVSFPRLPPHRRRRSCVVALC